MSGAVVEAGAVCMRGAVCVGRGVRGWPGRHMPMCCRAAPHHHHRMFSAMHASSPTWAQANVWQNADVAHHLAGPRGTWHSCMAKCGCGTPFGWPRWHMALMHGEMGMWRTIWVTQVEHGEHVHRPCADALHLGQLALQLSIIIPCAHSVCMCVRGVGAGVGVVWTPWSARAAGAWHHAILAQNTRSLLPPHCCIRAAALAPLIAQYGPPARLLGKSGNCFSTLAKSIVFQQLSVTAAGTIFGRLLAACEVCVSPVRAHVHACHVSAVQPAQRNLVLQDKAGGNGHGNESPARVPQPTPTGHAV